MSNNKYIFTLLQQKKKLSEITKIYDLHAFCIRLLPCSGEGIVVFACFLHQITAMFWRGHCCVCMLSASDYCPALERALSPLHAFCIRLLPCSGEGIVAFACFLHQITALFWRGHCCVCMLSASDYCPVLERALSCLHAFCIRLLPCSEEGIVALYAVSNPFYYE